MKKVTADEVAQMPKAPRGNLSPVYYGVLNLESGENLHVSKDDWGRKYPISNIIRRLSKKYNRQYTLTRLANEQGWIISRVK